MQLCLLTLQLLKSVLCEGTLVDFISTYLCKKNLFLRFFLHSLGTCSIFPLAMPLSITTNQNIKFNLYQLSINFLRQRYSIKFGVIITPTLFATENYKNSFQSYKVIALMITAGAGFVVGLLLPLVTKSRCCRTGFHLSQELNKGWQLLIIKQTLWNH